MNYDYKPAFSQYKERIKRMALHEPLLSLERKKVTDLRNKKVNMYDLGLITLLFFFENKLIRNTEVGVEELCQFLETQVNTLYHFNAKEYQKIARDLIEAFRPSSGKRLSRKFYNFEIEHEDTVYFSLLKASKSDIKDNRQYYELDEDGLELIFSTKEYFSEYQISISQMLLRKQLEKGEYIGALRQIEEMQMNVNTLQERIERIKREVVRNITSEEVSKRYKKLVEDIHHRLEREDHEFELLSQFIQETLKNLAIDLKDEKDYEIYSSAIRVDRALSKVHQMHHKLFNESIDLKSKVLLAAKEALYHVGLKTFNFNREIVGQMLTKPLSLEDLKPLVAPFLKLDHHQLWSPMAVFFPQRIINQDDTEVIHQFLDIMGEEEHDQAFKEKVFGLMMETLLNDMGNASKIELKTWIASLQDSVHAEWLNTRIFYDFWMVLHQYTPVVFDNVDEEQHQSILTHVAELCQHRYKALHVKELKEILQVNQRFSVNNMVLELEVRYAL